MRCGALGARRSQVVWMVLRSSLAVSVGGVAVGLMAAIWSAPVVRTFLYGLEPRDPATLIAAAANMLAVSVAAALLPALRAARMEPLTALRRE